MEREGEKDHDKDGWERSRGSYMDQPSTVRDGTPATEWDMERSCLRLSPGVGCDSTAQGDMFIFSNL